MAGENSVSFINQVPPVSGLQQSIIFNFNGISVTCDRSKFPETGASVEMDIKNPLITQLDNQTSIKYMSTYSAEFVFRVDKNDYGQFYQIISGQASNYLQDLVDNIPEEESQKAYSQIAQLPDCAYPLITIENRIKYLGWLAGELILNDDQEIMAIQILNTFTDANEKLSLINHFITNPCMIKNFMIHLDGENKLAFMTKLAQIYKEVSPPDYAEVLHEYDYFQPDGSVRKYSRMFEWKETLGADLIFTSTVTSNCNYVINTTTDWLLVFSVEDFLMTLKPFDYIAISAENYNGQLPDKVTGHSIVIIPAFMLHYILQKEETAQLLESISMYADLGLTVATLGSYTAGKTVLMLGAQVAIGTALDFTIQAGIKSLGKLSFGEAVYQINPRDALWTGVSTLIDNPKMGVALDCFRNNLNIILSSQNKSLADKVLEGSVGCIGNILSSVFLNKLIGNGSKYHGLLIAVFLETPKETTIRLLDMGVDPVYILSLTQEITDNIVQSSIKQAIENYGKE